MLAIEKYTHHLANCNILLPFTGDKPSCSCGLRQALAELQQQPDLENIEKLITQSRDIMKKYLVCTKNPNLAVVGNHLGTIFAELKLKCQTCDGCMVVPPKI